MALVDSFVSQMQKKLDVLEEVRALLRDSEDISVPGVVVAGAQSSGKSSVIESLCGINLPRGETITTRVPLMLRLTSDSTLDTPFALVSEKPDFSDAKPIELSAVGKNITRLTVKLAGDGGGVKDLPIHVKVTLKSGPTMTLIDLPGITHVSEDGDEVWLASQTFSCRQSALRALGRPIGPALTSCLRAALICN